MWVITGKLRHFWCHFGSDMRKKHGIRGNYQLIHVACLPRLGGMDLHFLFYNIFLMLTPWPWRQIFVHLLRIRNEFCQLETQIQQYFSVVFFFFNSKYTPYQLNLKGDDLVQNGSCKAIFSDLMYKQKNKSIEKKQVCLGFTLFRKQSMLSSSVFQFANNLVHILI